MVEDSTGAAIAEDTVASKLAATGKQFTCATDELEVFKVGMI